MPPEGVDPAAQCPVDHQTREKWLEAAKAKGGQQSASPPIAHPPKPIISPPAPRQQHPSPSSPTIPSHFSLDTNRWETFPTFTASQLRQATSGSKLRLSTSREISTIPRTSLTSASSTRPLNSAELAALPPANSESESGSDAVSGNWIYPSQEMFFSAMKRKGHEAEAADMESIVPIHNAVNERAWAEIKGWEAGRGAEKCGGPSLVSFAGDSKALTPRARWNSLLGYQVPFDRHDWVVDRCGKRIEYVIDFYTGKAGVQGMKSLSFYLDVRPKLNSWEGIKMRVMRTFGM